jgi:hypothetical protein
MKKYVFLILLLVPQVSLADFYITCGKNPQNLSWKNAAIYFSADSGQPELLLKGKRAPDPEVLPNSKSGEIVVDVKFQPVQSYRYIFNVRECGSRGIGFVRVVFFPGDAESQTVAKYPCVCAED